MAISVLRNNILPTELTTAEPRVLVRNYFSNYLRLTARDDGISKTPGSTRGLMDFPGLVKEIIDDNESQANLTADARVGFIQGNPYEDIVTEVISWGVTRRVPGAYSQGTMYEGKVKNIKPILREEVEDPDNPGYRIARMGYFYDNTVTFVCWAKTNKAANERAFWFEQLMLNYDWYFRYKGMNRVIFEGRGNDVELKLRNDNNVLYGRPLDYFIRDERIVELSEKTIERLIIEVGKDRDLREFDQNVFDDAGG